MNFALGDVSPYQLMALPFAECLVLVGIHSYLGLHVIRRQVIFVDLSLAQIAALGTTVAFWIGIQRHSVGAFLFSMSFTFLGAAIFALTGSARKRVSPEAIIGLVYAVAAALAILVIDRAPHGAEHIKEVLTGNILYVRGKDVLKAALAYSAVGLFHYTFRGKFIAITEDAEAAAKSGLNVPLWNLLFYMSFGFVITFSVETAGVLLVFVFLVAPAMLAVSLTNDWKKQLLIGWGLGTLVTLVGLTLSYVTDAPSGPMVVAFYALVLVLAALTRYVLTAPVKMRALRNLSVGILVVLAVFVYFVGLKKLTDVFPTLKQGELAGEEARAASASVQAPRERHKTPVQRFDSMDMDTKAKAVAKMTDLEQLETWFGQAKTPGGRLMIAKRVLSLDKKRGVALLIHILDSKAPPYFLLQAAELMGQACGGQWDFDPDDPASKKRVRDSARKCLDRLGGKSGGNPEGKLKSAPASRPAGTSSP